MADRLGTDRTNALMLVAAMVALMWATEIVDSIGFVDLDRHGIQPRDADGLAQIVAAPFLHVGFGHLISNTLPFLVLGATIALGGFARIALVTLVVALVSGVGTWLVAPEGSVHLGASGVVFGYATYLVTRGLFSRRLVDLGVGAIIAGVWGIVLLQGVLPQARISWQAHLFGAVGGVVAARVVAGRRRPAD